MHLLVDWLTRSLEMSATGGRQTVRFPVVALGKPTLGCFV